jgi:hypothetical protein
MPPRAKVVVVDLVAPQDEHRDVDQREDQQEQQDGEVGEVAGRREDHCQPGGEQDRHPRRAARRAVGVQRGAGRLRVLRDELGVGERGEGA